MRITFIAILFLFFSCRTDAQFLGIETAPEQSYVIGNIPVKLKGINIVPNWSVSVNWETCLAYDWDNQLANWIRPTLIKYKEEANINCVRMIGVTSGIHKGFMTRQQYHDRTGQLIQLCDSLGLYFYGTAAAWGWLTEDPELVTTTTATGRTAWENAYAEIASYCAYVSQFDNVIGIDVYQEGNTHIWAEGYSTGTMAGILNTMLTRAKDSMTGRQVPLTVSLLHVNFNSDVFTQPLLAAIAANVDFWDFHPYYRITNYNDFDPLATYGKPVFLGEYAMSRGGDKVGNPGDRNAILNDLATDIYDDRIEGFLWWCAADDVPVETYENFQWGLLDGDLEPWILDDWNDFAAIPIPTN